MLEAPVCGLLLVLDASSFTGGAGAAGSSATGSAPSGPSGPTESSRLSSVVDWVILPWRRGPRDLRGADFAPAVDAMDGESGAGAVLGEEGCSIFL